MGNFFTFNFVAVPEFFVAFFLIIQGILVLIQNPKKPLNQSFFFFELAVFIWLFNMALAYTVSDASVAFLLTQLGIIGVMYIPISTYAFSVYFAGDLRQKKIIIAGLALTIMMTPLVRHPSFSETVYRNSWGYYIQLGSLSYLVLVLFFLFIPLFIANLYRAYASAPAAQKRRYFSTLIVGGLAFLGMLDFLPAYGINTFLPFGYVFVGVFATLMSYFILRYHLTDVKIILGRGVGYLLLTVILFLISITFFALFFGFQNSLSDILWHSFFSILILSVFFIFRQKGQRLVDEIFFKEKINFERLITQFNSGLRNLRDSRSLLATFFQFMENELRIQSSAVYIASPNEMKWRVYEKSESLGPKHKELISWKEKQEYFSKNTEIINIKETREESPSVDNTPRKFIEKIAAASGLLIPLVRHDSVTGFIVLGNKLSEEDYTSGEISDFYSLASSFGIAWENAEHYDSLQRASEAKNDFISIVSHQLRTPMTNLRWSLEMLSRGRVQLPDEDEKSLLRKSLTTVKTMIVLIQQLMDLMRIENGKLKLEVASFNLTTFIDELIKDIHPLCRQKNIAVATDIPAPQPYALTDRNYAKIVLTIILENAVQYTKAGGKIKIQARSDGSRVVITVADTGIGIPFQEQGYIFNKFFRAANAFSFAPNGTGIGLFYAKKLIEVLGGTIWFRSEEDKGTTFFVTLPIK